MGGCEYGHPVRTTLMVVLLVALAGCGDDDDDSGGETSVSVVGPAPPKT